MTRPLIAVTSLLFLSSLLLSQPAADSISVAKIDSTSLVDSLQIRYIPGLGRVAETASLDAFDQTRLIWTDTKHLTESLWRMPGLFVHELGEAGMPTQLSTLGDDLRSIAVLMDGRPMNDPATGAVTLSDFPLELIDEVQDTEGPERIFSSSAAGGALNLVTRFHNSLRPITRIRFLQDPKESILTDVFFTQNILRGTNLLFGFQRQSSMGRYVNAKLDEWNLRTRLRWNITDRLNLAFTHLYIKSLTGMNSGIDLTRSVDPFEATLAESVNETAYAIRERHDVTIAGIGRFLRDSTATTRATAYFTTVEREYAIPSSFIPLGRSSSFLRSSLLGVRIEQRVSWPFAAASIAAEQEWRGTENTGVMPFSSEFRTAGTALISLNSFERFTPRISVRVERRTTATRSSYAAGLSFPVSQDWQCDAEASTSYRFPTLQEIYWTDTLLVRRSIPSPETHHAIRLGAVIHIAEIGTLAIRALRKTIVNALAFQPDTTSFGSTAIGLVQISERIIHAITAELSLTHRGFSLDGTASYISTKEGGTAKYPVPGVILSGEFSYQGELLDDALKARVGLRARFTDHFRGFEFDPRSTIFFENETYQLGRATTFDLFGVFHIGDAYVTVAFLNVLSAKYLTVPIYPMPPRQFRLGVNWTFHD